MTERISWVNELAVKNGNLETFRELMEEMVAGARESRRAHRRPGRRNDHQALRRRIASLVQIA